MSKDNFLFHFDDMEILEDMNDEEVGKLFRSVIAYAKDGTEPEFKDRFLKSCFRVLSKRHDNDKAAYDERCKKNAENGAKGGRPKKANAFEEKQPVSEKTERFSKKAKKADIDTDSDTDIDIDIDIDSDTDIDINNNISNAPSCAVIVPSDIAHEIKAKVVTEGDLSDLAESTWIQPAKLVQDKNNIYICSRQERAAVHLRDHYGGYFKNAIRAVNPDFSGDVIFAIA